MKLAKLAKLTSLIFALIMALPAFAGDEATLSELENRFFLHDFVGQDTNTRLARLEKNVFGESLQGTTEERLNRLTKDLPSSQAISSAQPSEPVTDNTTQVNDVDCAIQRAQVAIKAADEEQTTKLLTEAVKLFRGGKLVESRDLFEQVIQLDPNNVDANFSLGIIDEGSGNLAEALSSYRKALASKPEKVEYRNAVAALQEKMKKYAGLDSRSVQVRSISSAAMRAYMKGDYEVALNLYLALDEKSPNQAICKSNLATVYIALNQPDKAVDYYKQAMKLNPYDERFKQGLAHAENLAQKPQNNVTASLEDKLDKFEAPQGDSSFQNLGLRGGQAIR
ncbi:MAG: tetratricopeptide repeat protein [Candidatus Obscuribacterales bacterium]|nr:tetratricopeptide repeat protein [Candidatus Obscuribacterales bacterium]